ncbi:MAG: hypothetical protein IT313_10390 [Anaerolineales bacterium]|nr:hypothetical protein [Anaerolineales bacterium]
MGDTPFYRRPWFYIVGWLVILLVAYFWDIFSLGGIRINEVRIFLDLFCAFPFLLVVWMAFFSQFILPVRTFSDRQKIFNRLIARLFGSRGPAIFIKNGIEEKELGEERRKGPGVLWLDSASAAVTRTATKIKQTLGPGVHFIEAKETIAGTVDLHIQTHTVGPTREGEKPFAEKKDDQPQEAYDQIQDRRKQVNALTRDGIEVVPTITVVFRVDTGFPKDGKPGSRFGYRTGVAAKDKRDEKADQTAIRNAIIGEGINPYYKPENPRYRMAWNQLPAALAVDVWREYASKFKLEEFFTSDQDFPTPPPPPIEPAEEEIDPLTEAILVGPSRAVFQTALAKILREVNKIMARSTAKLEKKPSTPAADSRPYTPPPPPAKIKTEMKTAFEVINAMVAARLTQQFVDALDELGKRPEHQSPPPVFSREFQLLTDRGLKVLSVSIDNPRLNPAVDDEIIGKWEANWLKHAKGEKDQVQQRRNVKETASEDQAIRQYAETLSKALVIANPQRGEIKEALKMLIQRTRGIIYSKAQLRKEMSAELHDSEDILRWIEGNGP